MTGRMFRYRACGLEIASELEARHLPAGDPFRSVDLRIHACQAIEPFRHSVATPQWRLGHNRVHLFGHAGEECLCTSGTEIAMYGTAPILDETCTLLGRALATICLQRGLPVFHAAILERAGQGVALAGLSGAGKSTLAMELVQLGYRIVADDIAACDVADDGVVARPLYPVTRRRGSGQAVPGWKQIPGTGKQVTTAIPFCIEPRRLHRMFVIEVSGGGPVTVRDLVRSEAAKLLEAHSYRKGLARALLGYEGLKRIAALTADHLPVSLVRRPPDCPKAMLSAAVTERLERP